MATTVEASDATQHSQVHKGQCFCGQVEVEVTGEAAVQGYCHCESCRSMSGAPIRGFTLFPADAVRITRGEGQLKGYSKTDFSDRRHCANCGGQVLINHPSIGLTDVHAETLKGYNKTDFSDRRHCANCGGQVLINHPTIGMVDVHAETLKGYDFQPSLHVNYQERVLPVRDGLPKYKDFPEAFGGSNETIPE